MSKCTYTQRHGPHWFQQFITSWPLRWCTGKR